MYSPFTFNPNAHRASSNYQQQQQIGFQKPLFNIGTTSGSLNHSQNLLVNHCAFTRSFASVVSCENNMGIRQNMSNVNKESTNQSSNSNSGIIGSFLKHFNKPSVPQYPSKIHSVQQHKEFEDYKIMPSLSVTHIPTYNAQPQQQQNYQQSPSSHINIKISTPSDSCFQAQQSANKNSYGATKTRKIMASLFGGCQQQQQQQGSSKGQRWNKKVFRYRGGSWRSQSNDLNKFHERDVNLPKNVHEKERSSIERDILDDTCDFVHVVENKEEEMKMSSNNPNETAKGSCYTTSSDEPPFMIYSLEEFPAIVTSRRIPNAVDVPTTEMTLENTCEEGFVVLPSDASISTPSFIPKRTSLCERIIKSPQKLFSKPPPCVLKPCLKTPTRRRMSECSDDFIEFAYCGDDQQRDISFSDSESETDSEEEDDDDDEIEMTGIIEEKDDEMSEEEEEDIVDGDHTPEHQVDSGVEERKVICAIINEIERF